MFLTYGGQLRRMHPKWFEKLGEQEEEKDRPRECFRTLSDATLYFFTDRGNCYPLSVAGLPEANRPKERGTLLTGLLAGLEKGERAVRVLCLRPGELEKTADLLFVTANGMSSARKRPPMPCARRNSPRSRSSLATRCWTSCRLPGIPCCW